MDTGIERRLVTACDKEQDFWVWLISQWTNTAKHLYWPQIFITDGIYTVSNVTYLNFIFS